MHRSEQLITACCRAIRSSERMFFEVLVFPRANSSSGSVSARPDETCQGLAAVGSLGIMRYV